MDHISRVSASAPKGHQLSQTVVMRVTWAPDRNLTHITITASKGDQGDFYGPWETSCSCHGGSGPIVQVMTALDAWWRSGAIGMELWQDEQAHVCRLETRHQPK